MYAYGNPKTKKQLKKWVAAGRKVKVFAPGPFGYTAHGTVIVEGPHAPKPHTWYASVELENGVIIKVLN